MHAHVSLPHNVTYMAYRIVRVEDVGLWGVVDDDDTSQVSA